VVASGVPADRQWLSLRDAVAVYGIGRATYYRLAHEPAARVLRIRGALRIHRTMFEPDAAANEAA
jgi:hypothetical protein